MRPLIPEDDWLSPVRSVLDSAHEPVQFFFRDDDAGWDDARLYALLDCFLQRGIALDLAVIPTALGTSLASNLRTCVAASDIRLGLHQHGYSHTNHEAQGRKHEFGPSRSREQQYQDLRIGQQRLQDLLGVRPDPIFTPPWNRCTEQTADCLSELGWRILSRDSSARPLDGGGVLELPVRVDWLRKRQGVRIGQTALGAWIAQTVTESPVVGIMLHHAIMDENALDCLCTLLDFLNAHPQAQCRLMRDVAGSVIMDKLLNTC